MQLTGSIGDRLFEPVKRSSLDANNVSYLQLKKDPKKLTLIITASDGLWSVVDACQRRGIAFDKLLANYLTAAATLPATAQHLAEQLTSWAHTAGTDDVTTSVCQTVWLCVLRLFNMCVLSGTLLPRKRN